MGCFLLMIVILWLNMLLKCCVIEVMFSSLGLVRLIMNGLVEVCMRLCSMILFV